MSFLSGWHTKAASSSPNRSRVTAKEAARIVYRQARRSGFPKHRARRISCGFLDEMTDGGWIPLDECSISREALAEAVSRLPVQLSRT